MFKTIGKILESAKEYIKIEQGRLNIVDKEGFRAKFIDELVYTSQFHPDKVVKDISSFLIMESAYLLNAIPSSIQDLYCAIGEKKIGGFTVPAINIRGLTYDLACAIFRVAKRYDVGAFIIEIARSEINYTMQSPKEYSSSILGAAVHEGFEGPVFIQGDHFQVNAKRYKEDKNKEIGELKKLIKESIEAGFYNIDIDSSTIVDLTKESILEQQRPNFEVTSELAQFMRAEEPHGIEISIGGEIGEIGGKNSTSQELMAYLDGFKDSFGRRLKDKKGLSKVSIQTGTTHGGVLLPDGSIARVNVDFDTISLLSKIARDEYRLGGVVQHGASTLPDEAFDKFPLAQALEIHLATGFQNIIYDSPNIPIDFKHRVYEFIKQKFLSEKEKGETEEQFLYKIRKRGFGPLKKEWWDLPQDTRIKITNELESKFVLLFSKLKVVGTKDIVKKFVIPKRVFKEIPKELKI